jgi:tetratricopeptide (TPR) repeat protein
MLYIQATPQTQFVVKPQSGDQLIQHVNHAFKQYHSILALSHSPLAHSPLVAPALIRDSALPTEDERGNALRLVLQWAVSMLAPEPPGYPLGEFRPYDDPSWRDPRWWRYNILRHRYLEPLHPDEFVEGGRYTETLIALTGISTADALFDERNRAISEVAAWLRQQLTNGGADDVIRHMALEDALRPTQGRVEAQTLLGIAAMFEEPFPRAWLTQMAKEEHVAGIEASLAYLISRRLLLTDQDGAHVWLPAPLQTYVYNHQPEELRRRRGRQAARLYAESGAPLHAIEHWQKAGQWSIAAKTILNFTPEAIQELPIDTVCDLLGCFTASHLDADQWYALQILLCDLTMRLGRREEALTACRRALQAARRPQEQARAYRRIGKLYEQHNQLLALSYYQQAEERFDSTDPELAILLKDRAWCAMLRREWSLAEADLSRALASAPEQVGDIRADVYAALAYLNSKQRHFDQAVIFARQALALREERGSLPQIADSYNNLGVLYSEMPDYPSALAAFHEALTMFQRISNQERVVGALVNIGMIHHLNGRLRQAVASYREALALCTAINAHLITVRAYSNLAEALAELGEDTEARECWSEGYQISLESAFEDEIRYLEELRAKFPALQAVETAQEPFAAPESVDLSTGLDSVAQHAISIAVRAGSVTPKVLMEVANISKPTATRRLTELVRRGCLRPLGKGRATAYVPSSSITV